MKDPIRLLGFGYALMFFFIAIMGYIPQFVDENGLLFGLFTLDMYDNGLHAFSGMWALVAALLSREQIVRYFKLFGTVYFLDGVMGLFLGNAFLDFGVFQYGIAPYPFIIKVFMNIPHIGIGGMAMAIGFVLAKRLAR